MKEELITAAGLGAVTGLRSMAGLAMTARELSGRRVPRRAGRLHRWLARDAVAATLGVMAVGELIVDKLPGVPDRVGPGPLGGRTTLGALLGALAVDGNRLAGAAVGAAAAVTAAYGGWFLRREFGRATMLPDPFVAVAEDALALAGAREMADRI
ncbi:MAG: DUF4126 domain-containing protein [Gemmatimonadetes bacterium]|nr:DUF4126 domain-containing protein [Gemmatimonadota bacterium]NIQ52512.1 DUF4126 domain-containing protein [Gemmatimonadota bacterium]NIU72649.1 DUF4126 domain-containing protein [Gammaproteobacteria bacterium]NIX43051.1 DUF4126 domain-containing protein [Gemmatimonadota bacterium]NIY07224.1 DUF4126 domain-containing protein [Gemmatimonadota bacterium]